MLTSIRRAALGAALAGAALGATPALSSAALPQTCVKDGVCFSKQRIGAGTKLTVTGTPGADTIVVAHANATSNNVGSGGITVNGQLVPGVSEGARLTFAINALGGDDRVSEVFPTTTQPLYGTSTIDGGEGDDVIAAAFRSDVLIGGPGADVLDGGAGDDQLLAQDGRADTLHGGLGTDTAQRDAIDSADGVEANAPVVGRAKVVAKGVHAGRIARLRVSWTHPKTWRSLKMINLKAFDGDTPLGDIYVRMRDQRVTATGLALASSHLTRHGRTAKADLGIRLPRSLAGKTLRLDVEAADRDGHLQLVSGAGVLKVAR
jgi:Ca2+-binding RTX toxin-like protein